MTNIDEQIRAALAAAGAEEDPDLAREESILRQAFGVLHGRNRWLNAVAVLFQFIFMVLLITCIVKFVGAEEVKWQIFYAAGFLYSGLAIAMLKMWFWMQMNRNVILREIKRLELQVARSREGAG